MSKSNKSDFLNQFKDFSIHEHDYKKLSKQTKKEIAPHQKIEFYSSSVNKHKELNKILKKYVKHIHKNKDGYTNAECIMITQILELLNKMYADDFRKLKLERLI